MRGKSPLLSKDKIIEMQQKYWICDNSRAKRELGFSPNISLKNGIKDTVNWYKKDGWL
jgi:nucleoside-diphosphate-sugar epimerase